mmetsp:Transcript_848/g.1148  ORF Transcript_848/g.1148 Transcript_848/m.1148 type:complete len:156 (+) Transcript_848:221-688(+)
MLISAPVSKILILTLGFALPSYRTFKSVRAHDNTLLREWCIYWLLIGFFVCFEWMGDIFLSWFPLYYEAKLALVIYLWNPRTRGASLIFNKYVEPLLLANEDKIDNFLQDAQTSLYYFIQNQTSRLRENAFRYLNYFLEQTKSMTSTTPSEKYKK